jgi:hypothetical protein
VKILFVARSVFHFSYYESIIRSLLVRGHNVEVIFDEAWSDNQSDVALKSFVATQQDRFSYRWGSRRQDSIRNLLFGMRELRSYASYLRRPEQSDFYLKRWANYLPASVRWCLNRKIFETLLRTDLAEKLFLFAEKLTAASVCIVEDIAQSSPDVIIASPGNMRFDEEIEYVKAGKKLGIPTAILVLSWDNLTTKGLFHIRPDLLLCWNDVHKNEANSIHHIEIGQALEIGSTVFDKWFDSNRFLQNRDEFCQRVGIDPKRPYFLYLGSSSNIARDETWLVDELINAMRSHRDPGIAGAQLLIRPHPANAHNYVRFENVADVAVWPKVGRLPESEDEQAEFYNSVQHAVAAVGINTSGMIDNIIIGRPCVALVSERYAKTQNEAMHFGHLSRSDAIEIADSSIECANIFAALLHKQDEKKEPRQLFIRRFVRPHGIEFSAGVLGAKALEILGNRGAWSLQARQEFLATIGE